VITRHRSLLTLAGAALAVSLGLAGCASTGSAPVASPAPTASTSPGIGAAGGVQNPDTRPYAAAPAAGVVPTRVTIPAIGVDSGLESLGIGAQGELDPPKAWLSAGWYSKGVVPGAVGPAIIAGHIDSPTGPVVFLHLHELRAGDAATVTLSSGSVETFRVTGHTVSPKSTFPTSIVYGPTPTPTLRLITCDGVFNPAIGHYDDNLIVFADLESATAPTAAPAK
jgi:sortase (surface protein transpeptidase)